MKSKSKAFSLLMAITLAFLFVSVQKGNSVHLQKASVKIQPPAVHQIDFDNNLIQSTASGVR
jgi:hypothetical protein